jgi:ParB-like chromosome segregation protein Spo0J
MDAGKVSLMQLAENEQREGLTESDRSKAYEELRRLYPKWSLKDLAIAINKDQSWVTRYLSASKVVPPVREAFEAGLLGISEVYAISQASERDQNELLRMKLDHGATRDDLVRSVRKARRKVGDSVRVSRIVIALPSGTKLVLSGRRLSLAEIIECLSECLDAAKKGLKEKLDARTWQSVMRDRAKGEARV